MRGCAGDGADAGAERLWRRGQWWRRRHRWWWQPTAATTARCHSPNGQRPAGERERRGWPAGQLHRGGRRDGAAAIPVAAQRRRGGGRHCRQLHDRRRGAGRQRCRLCGAREQFGRQRHQRGGHADRERSSSGADHHRAAAKRERDGRSGRHVQRHRRRYRDADLSVVARRRAHRGSQCGQLHDPGHRARGQRRTFLGASRQRSGCRQQHRGHTDGQRGRRRQWPPGRRRCGGRRQRRRVRADTRQRFRRVGPGLRRRHHLRLELQPARQRARHPRRVQLRVAGRDDQQPGAAAGRRAGNSGHGHRRELLGFHRGGLHAVLPRVLAERGELPRPCGLGRGRRSDPTHRDFRRRAAAARHGPDGRHHPQWRAALLLRPDDAPRRRRVWRK